MARKGRTKVIYKGTFVCIQTLCLKKTLNYHSFYFRHQHSPLTRCVPPARIKNLTADIARPTAHCQIPVIHIHNEHGLHPRHSRHYQLELQVCFFPS